MCELQTLTSNTEPTSAWTREEWWENTISVYIMIIIISTNMTIHENNMSSLVWHAYDRAWLQDSRVSGA